MSRNEPRLSFKKSDSIIGSDDEIHIRLQSASSDPHAQSDESVKASTETGLKQSSKPREYIPVSF